jgi:hypothetical protein
MFEQSDPNANQIKEVIVAAANVPASYATLLDLGMIRMRKGITFTNALNADIKVKFVEGEVGENIVTVQKGFELTLNYFKCYGELQFEYDPAGSAPTTGTFQVNAW